MLLTLIFSFFLNNDAHASFIPYGAEKVSAPESLVIMGKGISARHTGDSLALACTTEDCNTLRYAILNSDGVYFFGKPMSKTELGSGIEITRMLPSQNGGRGGITMFALTAGSIFLAPITVAPILILLGIDALIALSPNQTENLSKLDLIGYISRGFRSVQSKTKEGKVFLNTEGWNWSVSPKKVNAKRYCETIATVLGVQHEFQGGYCDVKVDHNTSVCDYNGYVRVCMEKLLE